MRLNYNVDYEVDGDRRTQTRIEAMNPGAAMAYCLKAHPDATIIKAWIEGFKGGYQEWLPPKVQRLPVKEPRPARALNKKERGCEMPFYDEVKGQGRLA